MKIPTFLSITSLQLKDSQFFIRFVFDKFVNIFIV